MCQHETRNCPRCGKGFECKPGNITQCQCYGVRLTDEERTFISQRYGDCLCRECLVLLKNKRNCFSQSRQNNRKAQRDSLRLCSLCFLSLSKDCVKLTLQW